MDITLTQQELVDPEGHPIGKVTDVISDPATLQPEWAVVKLGRFGHEHLIPIQAIEEHDAHLVVPFGKEAVKEAPAVKDHMAPSNREREELYRHYGMTESH